MTMKKRANLGHVRFDCHWQGLSVDEPALNHHRDHITTTKGSGQLCYSHMFISSKNTEHHQKNDTLHCKKHEWAQQILDSEAEHKQQGVII